MATESAFATPTTPTKPIAVDGDGDECIGSAVSAMKLRLLELDKAITTRWEN